MKFTQLEENYIRILKGTNLAPEYRERVLQSASLEFATWAITRGLMGWDEYELAQHQVAVRKYRYGTSTATEPPGETPKRLRPELPSIATMSEITVTPVEIASGQESVAKVTLVPTEEISSTATSVKATIDKYADYPSTFKIVLDEERHPTVVTNTEVNKEGNKWEDHKVPETNILAQSGDVLLKDVPNPPEHGNYVNPMALSDGEGES